MRFPGKHRNPRRGSHSRPSGQSTEPLRLYGLHTVAAALANPDRRISAIWLTENASRRLHDQGAKLPFDPQIVESRKIGQLVAHDAVHQGAVIETAALEPDGHADLAHMRLIVLLDRITDPHNVGAIMRSAVAFGADALMTTRRNSAVETAVLAKSASGALDAIHHIAVSNLVRTIGDIRDQGFICVGLDSSGTDDLAQIEFGEKTALVLGAEGSGLRQATRAACTHVARLDLPGAIKSLNVSNAAAVSLHVVTSAMQSLSANTAKE
jgi:23S rRNA (guanosine2251-2'-O)-methyltransferase